MLSPELVWGLVPRFLGVIYIFAFISILPQHHTMAGAHNLASMQLLRDRVVQDFPGPRKFLSLPTLLWIFDSDTSQRAMCVIGALCGAAMIYGGPLAPCALVVAWMLWLSLEPRGLIFPWDTMLQEAGFLFLFLPVTETLPSLSATHLPLPTVAFMVRWLLIRLMLGFAKEKFLSTGKKEFLYLRGFFVWMPLPTPFGWLGHHAPAWLLRFSLFYMFVAECVAPLCALFTGPPRVFACFMLVTLMAGIQLTGNWGFFNIGYALLCVCMLDTQSSIFDLGKEPWASTATSWSDLPVHLTMGVMFVISLFYLVFTNSWITRAWANWNPDFFTLTAAQRKKFWSFYRALSPLRAIAPFRVVNGYGVFPPKALPPMRVIPVFEGSDDGVHWKQYGYRFMPSFPDSRPPFIAPYHARLDQYAIYVPIGTDTNSYSGHMLPHVNPYIIASRSSLMHLVMQRLLEGDRKVLKQLGHNPFPDAPPKQVRLGLIAMTPTRPSELRATGHWWHIRRVGTLIPATTRVRWPEHLLLPTPELFHPDLLAWKRMSVPIRKLDAAIRAGGDTDAIVVAGSELTAADLAQFWGELVPMLVEARGDWSRVDERAAAVQARFSPEDLFRLERVLERYAWILRDKASPHWDLGKEPALPAMSNFKFHMLLLEVVLDGRAAYDAMLRDPSGIVARYADSTHATQLWTLGLLRHQQIMAHVRCYRTFELGIRGIPNLPSFFEYYDFLCEVVPAGEEFRPEIVKHDDGEFTIAGFYPPPPLHTSTAKLARG
ncbi:MAG: lipase maturation factor family protein [Polyangiales bacterium]